MEENWDKILIADPGEMDDFIKTSTEIPEGLIGGNYFLNGPSKMLFDGKRAHPFVYRCFRV